MKREDLFYEVERKNPLPLFRKKKLPIGIADAFEKRHGYKPLRACRLFTWIDLIHSIAGRTLVLIVLGGLVGLLSQPSSAVTTLSELNRLGFLQAGLAAAVICLLTHRLRARLEEKVQEFQRSVKDFYRCFMWRWEHQGITFTHDTGDEALRRQVDETMAFYTSKILLGEALGDGSDASWREGRGESSRVANEAGLGRDWKTYVETVRQKYNLYEFFAWEI